MQIERSEWQEALAGFTAQHRGWLVRTAIGEPYAPLERISCETTGRGMVVKIVAGGERVIRDPVAVHLLRIDGADAGLDVTARDGSTTHLEFRTPMPPERVDHWF